MHRISQIAASLHVQPEIRAIAEHARQDQGGRSGDVATAVAEFIDVFALNAIALARAPCVILAAGGITYPLYLPHMQMGYTILTAAGPVHTIEPRSFRERSCWPGLPGASWMAGSQQE